MSVRRPAKPSRPSLEQVAAEAGVSRATVSRVVNGASTVDPVLTERVRAAVVRLGYRPNLAARALVNRHTDTFALIASEPDVRVFGDPYFGAIVRGVTAEAGRAGYQLVLIMAQSHDDLDRVDAYARSGAADGVLLISQHTADDALPRALTEAGIPLVLGGRPHQRGVAVPYVDNDNVHGARLAARHLLAIGRRRIATVTGPADMTAGIDRLDGFRTELGARFDPVLVEQGDFTQAGGEAATERLLARAPDVDAVFAANDLTALGAVAALRRSGWRVPQDVALVGFDDVDLAASADPPLTTVRQETVLQGRAMVRLLLAQTRPDLVLDPLPGVGDLTGAHHVVLPVELVRRDSA